jgi:hypothetical protein
MPNHRYSINMASGARVLLFTMLLYHWWHRSNLTLHISLTSRMQGVGGYHLSGSTLGKGWLREVSDTLYLEMDMNSLTCKLPYIFSTTYLTIQSPQPSLNWFLSSLNPSFLVIKALWLCSTIFIVHLVNCTWLLCFYCSCSSKNIVTFDLASIFLL